MKIPLAASVLACAFSAVSPAVRAADAEQGRKIYSSCAACHAVTRENRTGPSLEGVVGRRAATVPGFRYSRAMRRSRIVWDEAALEAYLADPQGTVPGNTMPFPGIPGAAMRKDLIAYLATLK